MFHRNSLQWDKYGSQAIISVLSSILISTIIIIISHHFCWVNSFADAEISYLPGTCLEDIQHPTPPANGTQHH